MKRTVCSSCGLVLCKRILSARTLFDLMINNKIYFLRCQHILICCFQIGGLSMTRQILPAGAKSLTEAVVEALRADILTCRLLPGAKLKIGDLCTRFGVSLGAVREALSHLAAEGLVVAETQRGFQVAPVSAEDLADLTATRIDIEGLALRRSI